MRPDRVTLAAFVGFVLIAGAVSVAIQPSPWRPVCAFA
jgi:hypothetical protein